MADSQPQWVQGAAPQAEYVSHRNRVLGAMFAIFLGGLGIHKFYNGKAAQGVLYLLFVWTLIPSIVGFIEGIRYLTMSDQDYWRRYP